MKEKILDELRFSTGIVLSREEVVPRFRVICPEGDWTVFVPLPDDIGERQRRMQLVYGFMAWKSARANPRAECVARASHARNFAHAPHNRSTDGARLHTRTSMEDASMGLSRRGFVGFLAALGGGALAGGKIAPEAVAPPVPDPAPAQPQPSHSLSPTERLHEALHARVGDDIFSSWFQTLEVESLVLGTVTTSVPVKFLRNWIRSHYADDLSACCSAVFGTWRVDVVLRQPGTAREVQRRQII